MKSKLFCKKVNSIYIYILKNYKLLGQPLKKTIALSLSHTSSIGVSLLKKSMLSTAFGTNEGRNNLLSSKYWGDTAKPYPKLVKLYTTTWRLIWYKQTKLIALDTFSLTIYDVLYNFDAFEVIWKKKKKTGNY